MQLISVIVCMVMIANLQYGWTLFVNPLNKAHGWSIGSIQLAFSIFIALETWLTPIEGWIVDSLGPQRGPKIVVRVRRPHGGGRLDHQFDGRQSRHALSRRGHLRHRRRRRLCNERRPCGKVVPGPARTCGRPDRGGLWRGRGASVIPIRMVIAPTAIGGVFLVRPLQGGIVFLLAWLLSAPEPGEIPATTASKVIQSARSFTPGEVLKTPVFWLLYLMFVMVSASGLMATAQIAPIAKDFGVDNVVLLFGGTTITVALIVDSVANGGARPLFGWISDNIGREYTMAIAFALGGSPTGCSDRSERRRGLSSCSPP